MIEGAQWTTFWLVLFGVTQILYSLTFLVDFYHFSRPIDWVKRPAADDNPTGELPFIVLFFPVLDELEATMHTTLVALSRVDYPADRFRVIAIPNHDDVHTVASLQNLKSEFAFLELLVIPPTTDRGWDRVWAAWDRNPRAYWWRHGRTAGVRDLPPKKTRQLIYAIYHTLETFTDQGDFLINYIDADSCPPINHFRDGAAGMQTYDVLQSQNVAGNLNDSLAASWHAFDHMAWDGLKYPHLSANGTHPFWMLGKGLFFRSSDLSELGGLHPWMAIEDPEIGMRYWAAGKRLGVIHDPLIEEVPLTFGRGVTQRKRWVCGFFQSLGRPLDELGFKPVDKLKAWLNFLPCLSLWINAIGFPIGAWAIWAWSQDADILPLWLVWLSTINVIAFVISLTALYVNTWGRTRLVLERRRDRIAYMLRVNPLFILVWWVIWLVPLWLGFWMYLRGGGLVWERTEKINANEALIVSQAQKA